MSIAVIALAILWLALIAYAVLGADFGAGIWDLFAIGPQRHRQRDLINHALGPGLGSKPCLAHFPDCGPFFHLSLRFRDAHDRAFCPTDHCAHRDRLRGAAFIFRTHELDATDRTVEIWSCVFSSTSLITPFFLGTSAAAVASGTLITNGVTQANLGSAWLSPFALAIGAMAVTLCASLAAVYLTLEANRAQEFDLANMYRLRALVGGALTALLGALGLLLSISKAPILWNGMLTRAWPIVIITMLIGLATAISLYLKRYRLARVMIILETAFLLGSWGLSQYPYIIPPDVTIANSANDPSVIIALVISTIVGMAILLPSLYYLFSVFKLAAPVPGVVKNEEEKPNN